MQTTLVLQQMFVILMMIVLGFVLYKLQYLNDQVHSKLSSIVVDFLNPFMLISFVLQSDIDVTGTMMRDNFKLVVVYFIVLIVFAQIYTWFLNVPSGTKRAYKLMLVFSNVGFMGIPIVRGLYGDSAVPYVVVYVLVYNLLIYTLGIAMASSGNGLGIKGILKKTLNSGTVAGIISIIFLATGVQFPDFVLQLFKYLGESVIPISMILIGSSIGKSDLKQLFRHKESYMFSAVKILIVPILAAVVLRFVAVDPVLKGVFVILIAMPVGSIVSLIAAEYKLDSELTSREILISTVLIMVTLPIISLFM